ncbi:hypothetical protein [Nostoc sp. MS1]|uniref:hypothetical protein n=1 Tax=Nostoc sp. MS1 TaxID=2764711 RepID=UPI001CC3A4C7|nr:hypothetical protein [Nostoc sp. MS1]BCL34279.1 hypothetical protein NSMS1_07260 [Nostoc sp. MS1]
MAAFEGAAEPSKAIESGYYVQAPVNLLVDDISARVALRPFSSHLLIGGIGSGKTTQLLVACQKINEIEDIHAIYIDISLYTDISKISIGVLTAIVGLELAKLMQDSKDKSILANIKLIRDLAYGYECYDYNIDVYPSSIKIEGILPKKSQGYGINIYLVNAVRDLAKAASLKYGNIVFIFDGLDRLDDTETFIRIVSSDAKAISSMGIGLVLVGPLTAIYIDYREKIEKTLDYFYYQPFFDVDNDANAYKFFEKIIHNRSSENFIEASAIKALIHFSGGVLRDFINLIQISIEEAYLSGNDNVIANHVLSAVDSFSRQQLLGISDNELKIIEQTMNTENFIPRTNEDLRLLVRRIILEYRYPKLRHSVHPAIRTVIENNADKSIVS